jgi:hypothetical protein
MNKALSLQQQHGYGHVVENICGLDLVWRVHEFHVT